MVTLQEYLKVDATTCKPSQTKRSYIALQTVLKKTCSNLAPAQRGNYINIFLIFSTKAYVVSTH